MDRCDFFYIMVEGKVFIEKCKKYKDGFIVIVMEVFIQFNVVLIRNYFGNVYMGMFFTGRMLGVFVYL